MTQVYNFCVKLQLHSLSNNSEKTGHTFFYKRSQDIVNIESAGPLRTIDLHGHFCAHGRLNELGTVGK